MTVNETPTTAVGTITGLTRLGNTADGNPRWRVHLDNGGAFLTKPDANVAHMVANYGPGATDQLPVRLTLSDRGLIVGASLLFDHAATLDRGTVKVQDADQRVVFEADAMDEVDAVPVLLLAGWLTPHGWRSTPYGKRAGAMRTPDVSR